MRLVFVNHAHPATPHVSGMRLWYFAQAMARRGHEVILLTGASPTIAASPQRAVEISKMLAGHDWSKPFVLEVVPSAMWSVDVVRRNAVPAIVRKALTAWSFVVRGGVFADWTRPAYAIAKELTEVFRPDLVWATFGNTSNLALAQRVAQYSKCAWVADIKDSWSAFIPAALRSFMAWRFRNAAGVTANAQHHLQVAARWLHFRRSCVVYSGVAA
jgi:hypothetical protein